MKLIQSLLYPASASRLAGGLAATFALALGSAVHAETTLFSDNFDGVSNSVAGLNSVDWWLANPAENGTRLLVGADNTGTLSGDSIWNPGSSGSNTWALKQFDSVTLTEVGDYVSVNMDLHFTTTPNYTIFTIALFGTDVTLSSNSITGYGTAGNPITDATGYLINQQPRTTATNANFRSVAAGETGINDGTSLGWGNGSVVLGDPTSAHTLVFTITKVEGGTELTYSVDGSITGTILDSSSLYDTFNTLRITAGNDSSAQSHWDNISVVTNIPEPSVTAGVFGAVALSALALRRGAR
ncbi:hypothetical protein [Puniceicoccus vermicola]|uniref:PEP-CTERM sorting domain-containing protein n=1 Tax=Puniceicoccus vermicola TaxID=388746 RepID=A0A7X1AZC5_9BACT|nr:hypothetical protein [Puniceicoccus vermicola]MBC2602771.1 hypothetical protein [Puniceicoccus vermicola]